ncbi:MAG: hypothetical protein V1742_07030 [Pseudomonadota bacterium]
MKKVLFIVLLLTVLCAGAVLAQDKMIITFKDGSVQSFDTNNIIKIEFQSAKPSTTYTPTPSPAPSSQCWTGRFAGLDTSGYAMDINLTEKDGIVTGGYSYFHKGENKQVTAIIVNAKIEGDRLRGTWKQIKGIIAEGPFEWKWLPGQKCQAFEGTFSGTKYWHRMTRK